MIDTIEIRNWQSLRNVKVELGAFTAILGDSRQGKSAFMRALRALASNVTGTDMLTQGTKTAMISARLSTGSVVTLEYGKYSSDTAPGWFYRAVVDGQALKPWTKLNRSVPEEVTSLLGLRPVVDGLSVNFAGQHDPPFLLTSSPAEVARVLGELTQVDRIFEAVRLANRKKNSTASTLRTREGDLAEVTAQAEHYLDLPAKLTVCADAEQALDRVTAASREIAGLDDRERRLRQAAAALEAAQDIVWRLGDRPVVPDTAAVDAAQADLDAAQARLDGFKTLVRAWATANVTITRHREDADRLATELTGLDAELHEALAAAGQCPTCGQTVQL